MVSAAKAIDPDTMTMTICAIAVMPNTTRLILTARMPAALDSSAVSRLSAASCECGAKISLIAPRKPVGWRAAGGMPGVADRVGDELTDVIVFQPIEHLPTLATGPDRAGHSQLGKMPGHRRWRFADAFGEVVDAELAVDQRPEQLYPGGVGQHPEHLHDQQGVIVSQLLICIHT